MQKLLWKRSWRELGINAFIRVKRAALYEAHFHYKID